jgi:hypothetical protein
LAGIFFFSVAGLLLSGTSRAAETPATFTRVCSSCGLRDIETFVSQSGQFVVHGSAVRGFVPRATGTNAAKFITAEPQMVALMGERVSRALAQELNVPQRYWDKIHVTVFNFARPGQLIGLITEIYTDGFLYRMTMPSQVEGNQLMKGLLQALLQEFSNRGHRRAGELPNWVVEGMLRQIQTGVMPTYVVNRKPMTIEVSGYDRLGATRDYLKTNAPMTLQDLSFADLTRVTPEQREQFEASSHLLVHQLLRLKGGAQLMAQFLRTLPTTLNWQTAFYAVYKDHFAGPLEFEKWWMLNWVQFRNSQEREMWSMELTLDRLESVLLTAMEVRLDANSLPHYREATLQEFLQLADFATQKAILSQKIQQMYLMSLSVPTQAMPLWNRYAKVLEEYLQKRGNDTQPTLKREPEQRLQALLRGTLKTLDELDVARAELNAGRTPVIPTGSDVNQQARR